MLDLKAISNRYGYISLFGCNGSINKDFVAKLDKFFLNKLKPCETQFGDNRKIVEFLEYASSVQNSTEWRGSGDIVRFDKELVTWNK